MRPTMQLKAFGRLFLKARTAQDLMVINPVSIQQDATVQEAAALLTDRGFSAAPVIDEAGRPVGVVSRTDLVRHSREHTHHLEAAQEYYGGPEPLVSLTGHLKEGYQIEVPDATLVRDIMTPVVFCVEPQSSVTSVVEEFLERKVHRLFVVDESGALIGVISTLDVLRRLVGEEE